MSGWSCARWRPEAAVLIALASLTAPAAFAKNAEVEAVMACAAQTHEVDAGGGFAHCVRPVADRCGAFDTADQASACLTEFASEVNMAAVATAATLTGVERAEMEGRIEGAREAGEIACNALAKEDARTGVTDAQKMVNEASCKLIASAEAVGAATAPADEDG